MAGIEHDVDRALTLRIDALIAQGIDIWERFDRDVRAHRWHSFVPANYASVFRLLTSLRAPGLTFLEWGSATGVITIMADMLGFVASGIELDPYLVSIARDLAVQYDSRARFVIGSFVPSGYRPSQKDGEGRLGTIGDGASAYAELRQGLDDFDIVYAYPWKGEGRTMLSVVEQYGGRSCRLLLHGEGDITIYAGGKIVGSVEA